MPEETNKRLNEVLSELTRLEGKIDLMDVVLRGGLKGEQGLIESVRHNNAIEERLATLEGAVDGLSLDILKAKWTIGLISSIGTVLGWKGVGMILKMLAL